MRRDIPTLRWMRRWQSVYRQHGGWGGSATLTAMEPQAVILYRAGVTAIGAGIMCARLYQLHSAIMAEMEISTGQSSSRVDWARLINLSKYEGVKR